MSSPKNRSFALLRFSAIRPVTIAVLVLSVPLVHAEPLTHHERETARQKIALMTEEERARLNSNFEEFRKLSPEQQRKLRELDRALRSDPELQKVKMAYSEFLEPLSAGERMDLESQPDPVRRAAMVRTIIKEQQERAEQEARRGAARRGLKPQDLAAVLKAIETHWRSQGKLTVAQADELESKKDLARLIAIYDLAFARPMPGDRLSFFAFPPELQDEIRNAISDPAQKGRPGDRDRIRIPVRAIFEGLSAEIEKQKPNEEVLGEFLAKLSGAEQGEILKLPDDQQQRALLRKYAEANPDKMPRLPIPPRGFFGGDRMRRREFGPGRNPERDGIRRPDFPPDGIPAGPPGARDNQLENRLNREKPAGKKTRAKLESQVAS